MTKHVMYYESCRALSLLTKSTAQRPTLRISKQRNLLLTQSAAYISSKKDEGERLKGTYDVTIVGGGIVGAATAHEVINRFPSLKCAIIEKEDVFGIYYKPGSLMARLCVDGLKKMYSFCQKHELPHEKCGKLIVATEPEELSRLIQLYERASINNVPGIRLVDAEGIKKIEPYCNGLQAIHSSMTGIADYAAVTDRLVELFKEKGGSAYTSFEVSKFTASEEIDRSHVCIHAKNKDSVIKSKYVITCAGLYSDRVAQMSGCDPIPKIVPFRGDYLVLKEAKRHMVRGNIYPVPDPRFPFLGFHFTPRVNGEIWLGPNAVLAFKREGYSPFSFSRTDFTEAVGYKGMRNLVLKNFSYAVSELYYGINLKATVNKLQRFIPGITPNDVIRGPSGVRAQALSPDGSLVNDFIFDGGAGELGPHMLHVRNAPSPAATSSLAIAEMVVDEAERKFNLTPNAHL